MKTLESVSSMDAMLPTQEQDSQGDDICQEFCMAIDDSESSTEEEPHRTLKVKPNSQSRMGKERQISVDPMSLKQSPRSSSERQSYSFMLPVTPASNLKDAKAYLPPPLPPTKSKFLSASLPGSATSSPKSGTLLMNLKKWRNLGHAMSSVTRQPSSVVSFSSRGSMLQKSKSCGEGRSSQPADEFDLWSRSLSHARQEIENTEEYNAYESYEVHGKITTQPSTRARDNNFKCGACLFLPGFGKGKPVRPPRKEEAKESPNVISRSVSMEKFECGSWASSAMFEGESGDSMSLYFDLPLELIRNNGDDAHSPVAAAFIFENDRKGVLKKSASRGSTKKMMEPSRHVRFSTSNPISSPASPCVSPSMRKARDDFNAYLQAQGV